MRNFLTLISVILIIACKKQPNEVDAALAEAGDNKSEIIEVINHYKKSAKDSLKLKALYFLVSNMRGKGSMDYDLLPSRSLGPRIKSTDSKSKLNLLSLCHTYRNATSDSLYYVIKDSLLNNTGFTYSFKKSKVKSDLKYVSKAMLIAHIDEAFDIWTSSPWKDKIPYETFCKYILPYRIDREPLQAWLPMIRSQANKVLADSGLTSNKDPGRVMDVLDNYLKKQYSYNRARTNLIPRQLDVLELSKLKGGTCEDLATISGYWLRAVGIPVAPIKIPIWSHMNAGHTMLSVVWGPKDIHAFNPFDKGNGIQYATFDTPRSLTSKIFMASFERSSSDMGDTILSKLYGSNLLDVTQFIAPKVSNIIVNGLENDHEYAYYLSVPNGLVWQPVQKGVKTNNGKLLFSNMTDNMLYMPVAIDKKGRRFHYAAPIIKRNGELEVLAQPIGLAKKYTFKTKLGWGIRKQGDKVDIFKWTNPSGWKVHAKIEANERLEMNVEAKAGELYAYKIINQSGLVDRPFSVFRDSIIVY